MNQRKQNVKYRLSDLKFLYTSVGIWFAKLTVTYVSSCVPSVSRAAYFLSISNKRMYDKNRDIKRKCILIVKETFRLIP